MRMSRYHISCCPMVRGCGQSKSDCSSGPVDWIGETAIARLAEMMENPVGDDDTDIDMMQQMHELEAMSGIRWKRLAEYSLS